MALLRNMICDLGDPMSLRHPVCKIVHRKMLIFERLENLEFSSKIFTNTFCDSLAKNSLANISQRCVRAGHQLNSDQALR